MREEPVFNPLDKQKLGSSVADALLAQPRSQLPPSEPFIAAGVYAIYYTGEFEPYRPLSLRNRADDGRDVPVYVGKAVPPGARKGGFGLDAAPGTVLFKRLEQHAESIDLAENLSLKDFYCRFLAVDDIWIPLGENLLIEMFSPLWNKLLSGFGNHDPGSGRRQQRISDWDVLHPGRGWAKDLQPGGDRGEVREKVKGFFKTHPHLW